MKNVSVEGPYPMFYGVNKLELTKREYFAGKALQGLCCDSGKIISIEDIKGVGELAFMIADGAIEAANKESDS